MLPVPYSLHVRVTKNNVVLQLCVAGARSSLWRDQGEQPGLIMRAAATSIPRSRELSTSSDDLEGPKVLEVPKTVMHSELAPATGLKAELAGRPILFASCRTAGYIDSKSKTPEAVREAALQMMSRFKEMVRRANNGLPMPVITKRPKPNGQTNRTPASWKPDLQPTKPNFVPPPIQDVELVLHGWRHRWTQTLLATLEGPLGYDLRSKVRMIRDVTPIVTRGSMPRARRRL